MSLVNTAQNHKTADLTELVGTQLFKQVSMAQVASLLRYCPTVTLSDGDRLIVPGQTVDTIHLLLQGRMQVLDGEKSDKPIGRILQGECVGLSSFVDRQPCHVSIVSEGISRLLVLNEERLMALINTPTTISRNLLFLLMNYLRQKAARSPEPVAAAVESVSNHNHVDSVTGLHNQSWLDETLDRLIMRAATDSAPLSLLAVDFLDLPGLTAQYGQELLDLSLPIIARTLSTSIRPTDLIARHATGRFIIMLPGSDQENTLQAAARILEVINTTDIVVPGVCVLPPMKVVMGSVRMNAFVSGRKLVDDAFSALEQNRKNTLAAMAELELKQKTLEAAETIEPVAVEHEQTSSLETVSDISDQEPSKVVLLVEPFPAAPDNSLLISDEPGNDENAFSDSSSLQSVTDSVPDELYTDNSPVVPAESTDENPHQAV